ncbi:MAG TPA: dephospho-CoA kinase [Rhodospirillaceae bacterium]|nr:dephospho-CoA kinase [Rhodospirillaceae bacterium]
MKKKNFLVIGITGGIGMGKSTAAQAFESLGLPVFDADACVHHLLLDNKTVMKQIATEFPPCILHGWIDRRALFAAAFATPKKTKILEGILHPLVWRARDAFVRAAKKDKREGVVLDIPLLFETGADSACDKTLCVYTSAATQKERVLKRKNMTATKLRAVRARQWPIAKTRQLADAALDMDVSKKQARQAIEELWKRWSQETK